MARKSAEKTSSPEVEAATEASEMQNPFQEQESVVVESYTERYAKKTEISKESKKAVDGFLARDTEKVYYNFALEWFDKNEEAIRESGIVIPQGASDEWKASVVLGSKEKGGMGASEEINDPEYRESREKLDKIGVLKTDMKKDQTPPETPFLLLNYLQKKLEDNLNELDELNRRATGGDASAEVFTRSKESEIKDILKLSKDIAGKTMGENLTEDAERKLTESGFLSKDNFVEVELDAKRVELRNKKNEEVIDREWQRYIQLPEKERKKYEKEMGCRLEMSRDDFDTLTATRGYVPQQAAEIFKRQNRDMFWSGIRSVAKDNGVEGATFYSLLEKGYKPHEAKTKGLLPGVAKLLGIKLKNELPPETFIKTSAENYSKDIEDRSKKELEDTWKSEHEEKINSLIEERIKELADSPEAVEGGVERIYKQARERIIMDYMKKRFDKAPKTKEQIASVEKIFNEKGKEKGNKKDINEFMSAVIFQKGRLEDLGDDYDDDDKRAMGGFLRDWGIKANINTSEDITEEEYKKARKSPTGFFSLMMKLIEKATGKVPMRKTKTKTK